MLPKLPNNLQYKQKQAEITRKNWQTGVYNKLVKPLETRYCKNPTCNSPFKTKPYEKKIYCSSRCAALINNAKRPKINYFCKSCNNQLKRSDRIFCSNKCQKYYEYKITLDGWQKGLIDGNIGLHTKDISKHIKRYLNEKFGEKCSICGWKKRNPITNKVPLEIDHIDGNSSNNEEMNLRLICPNCHSLTPHFRNLNKGHGRAWRQKRSKIV